MGAGDPNSGLCIYATSASPSKMIPHLPSTEFFLNAEFIKIRPPGNEYIIIKDNQRQVTIHLPNFYYMHMCSLCVQFHMCE